MNQTFPGEAAQHQSKSLKPVFRLTELRFNDTILSEESPTFQAQTGEGETMPLFHRREKNTGSGVQFDPERYTPVIRRSICTGERSAGFRDRTTGRTEEIMLIRDDRDLEEFRTQYGIRGPIQEIY